MTDHFTRDEAVALAKEVGVSLEFPSQDGMPTVYAIDENQIHALAEKLISAKLKEWEAQGAVGFVMKGREFPNNVFYPASHEPTDINNFDAVYTHALPAQPAEPVNAELVEALRLENFAADGWANSFYNALQHIKNLRDGITDFDSVLKNLEECERDSQRDWQKSNARAALSRAQAAPAVDGLSIERAARKLAERFDYPWVYMPDKGRETMRQHAQAILDAAQPQQKEA